MGSGRKCLVEKRDGRVERLRATKIARSIHLALCQDRVLDGTVAIDVAADVLAALHPIREPVPSAAIAAEVERRLERRGWRRVAHVFALERGQRERRRALVWGGSPTPGDVSPDVP